MKQQQLHKTNNTAELATGICHGALHDKVAKGGEGRAPPGTKGKCRGQVGCCHPSCPVNLTAVLQTTRSSNLLVHFMSPINRGCQ